MNMTLPARVQAELEAADAAQALYQQQRAESAAQAVQSVAELEPPAPAPVVVQPPPAAVAPAPAVHPRDDFESKYKVLQGMYAADVVAIKHELSALKAAAKAEPPAPNPMTEKDKETFGADLIEMVQRYAEGQQAVVNGRLDALEAAIGGVARSVEVSAEGEFFKTLQSLCPSYREVNADPKWLVWLGEKDAVYGIPRQAALNDARQKLDAPRTANVFNAFLASQPAAPVPQSLANQVVPTSVETPAAPAPQSKPFLSNKSIQDFYSDVGRGLYAGRQAEHDRIEAEINSAVAEGRVR